MTAIMSGVFFETWHWKFGPLRLRLVPPTGSSLLTAAASPEQHASNSARAGMLDMIGPFCEERSALRGGSSGGARGE
jgi:hypothetical protein